MPHDEELMKLNGDWELRQGLKQAIEHPEKDRVYNLPKGSGKVPLVIMQFPHRACAMFQLPPQSDTARR